MSLGYLAELKTYTNWNSRLKTDWNTEVFVNLMKFQGVDPPLNLQFTPLLP